MQLSDAPPAAMSEPPKVSRRSSPAGFWILAAALVAFAFGLCAQPSPIVDFFWQARTGHWILDHHAVPHGDLYSWTRHGHPWIVHEWAMCVLLWQAYTAGGYPGVWLLMWGLVSITFLTLFYKVWQETGRATLTAFALTLWAAKLCSPLISPRPHLISYLCLALLLWVVMDARRESSKLKQMWFLPPICAVWANFHGAVIIGIAIAATFAICDAIDARWIKTATSDRRAQMLRFAKQSAIVLPISAAATMINPYGWRLFAIFTQTVGDKIMPNFVTEWKSLDFHSSFGSVFEILMVLFVLGLGMSRERRDLSEVIVLLILMHAGLTASRNVPIFGMAGVLIAARHIQSALAGALKISEASEAKSPSLFGSSPSVGITTIVALAVCLQAATSAKDAVVNAPARSDTGLSKISRVAFAMDGFPMDACAFLRQEQFPTDAKLYNAYNWGSTILWSAPEYPVFISTQTDIFFGKVLKDYTLMCNQPHNWRKVLGDYNPDIVFLPANDGQTWIFLTDPEWALVYADDADLDTDKHVNAVIFVRRLPKYDALIARCRHDCAALREHPELTK
ncbi:hypothetical protein CCAX7_003430 [Capsulimonas corticalis]|uniref:Uncharacterized protein n=1 Tax=Capsulimonas corticalis TaxID=2219043 RepID=A0A402CS85_9BACT|nr:hypothetical protein [Capsulimonas corticalis]BDI28292.1 hypothetical protein CCAX7_003430 [Capsulimonas corticalis]